MKRDFSQHLTSLGNPMVLDPQHPDALATLGVLCIGALMGTYPDEPGLSGEEKFRRYQLADRIAQGGVLDVSAEEIALLKKLIGKSWSPAAVGPAWTALEQDLPEPAAEAAT